MFVTHRLKSYMEYDNNSFSYMKKSLRIRNKSSVRNSRGFYKVLTITNKNGNLFFLSLQGITSLVVTNLICCRSQV